MSARAESVDAEFKVEQDPDRHRAELRLWLRLLTCANLIEAEIRKRLREQFGTTLPRFDLMAQLERAPAGILLGEVSRRMMVSTGNVTGLVERLAQEGAIERLVSERDRRAVRVRLTPRGIREHLQLNAPIYQPTAAYGHFGREADGDHFTWERTDLVEKLKAAVA